MLKTVLAGVGVVAIAGVTAVALQAGYDDGYRSRSLAVNVGGLDLTTTEGVNLLARRVERAVHQVCDGGIWDDEGGERQCRDDAWAGARPQIWAAIDRARNRRAAWVEESHVPPRRWTPAPPPRDWADEDEEQRAGYVSAPPPRPALPPPAVPVRRYAPIPGQAPIALSGVLGGPIDGAIGQAFETGETTRWRDHGWRGVIQVSESREVWPNICRMVTVIRATDDGWTPVREGQVCLGRDGQLHNSRRY